MSAQRALRSLLQTACSSGRGSDAQCITSVWRVRGSGLTVPARRAFATAAAPDKPVRLWKLVSEQLSIYKTLSKLKLSLLVASTASAGFAAGSGDRIDWSALAWNAIGTLAASACANTLNQWYEIANDGRMHRTRGRPLPRRLISPAGALTFAAITGVSGVAILATQNNALTAGLGAANIALYAGVYTPLKQVHAANTWVGAVVGAIPPLMGWAAATGDLHPGSMVLSGMLYFWQLPHFMALAWMSREDYARGGYRMMSFTDTTGRRTAGCAMRNALYMVPLGLLATYTGVAHNAFFYENALLSGFLAVTAAVFLQQPSVAKARILFRGSLIHLPLAMLALLAHRIPFEPSGAVTWEQLAAAMAAGDLSPPRPLDVVADLQLQQLQETLIRPADFPPFPLLPVPHSLPCLRPSQHGSAELE